MRGFRAAAVLVSLLALAAPGAAQERKPAEDAAAERERKLGAVLDDLAKRLGALKTLRARFEQRKYLEVFEDVVTSEGTLALAAPDKLRWEYEKPLRSTLVVNGTRALRERTSRKGKTTRRAYALEDEPVTAITAQQVFLWTRGDFAKARESYDLSLAGEKPLVVRAVPREKRVRDVVASVELTFADDRRALTGVTLVEKGAARTEISFREIELDPELAARIFEIER